MATEQAISGLPQAPSAMDGDRVVINQDGVTSTVLTSQMLALAQLAYVTDIDFTTAGAGKVLAAVASGGKPYSFVTAASGSTSGGGSSTPLIASLVQSVGFSSPNGSTISATLPSAPTAGNALIAFICYDCGDQSPPVPAGSGWSEITRQTNAYEGVIAYRRTVVSGDGATFDLGPTTYAVNGRLCEIANPGTITSFTHDVGTSSSGTALAGPTATPTAAGFALVAFGGDKAATTTPAAGWTDLGLVLSSGGSHYLDAHTLAFSASEPLAPTITLTGDDGYPLESILLLFVSASGGSSSGSGMAAVIASTDTPFTDAGPTAWTALDGMAVTIAAASSARTILVSSAILFTNTGAHGNRFGVALDGTQVYPSTSDALPFIGQQPAVNTISGDRSYGSANITNVPIVVPGDGAAHTITIIYDVEDSTSANTFYDRSLIALEPSSGGSVGAGGSGGATLHAVQLAEALVTHVWRCNDVAGSTTLADSVGSSPLAVGSTALCGAGDMLRGGGGSVYLPGNAATDSISAAAGVLPTTAAWTLEFVCSLYLPTSGGVVLFACIGAAGEMHLWQYQNQLFADLQTNGSDLATNVVYPGAVPVIIHLTGDGAGNTQYYLNGMLLYATTSGTTATDGSFLFGLFTAHNEYFSKMRVQDVAVYAAHFTQAQVFAHAAAAGL